MYKSIKYCKEIKSEVFDKKSKYLFFIAENSKNIYNDIKLLENTEVYGAIFPEIIFDDMHYKEGVLVFELDSYIKPFIINSLIEDMDKYEEQIENNNTIITIVDGLSPNIQTYLENFYEIIDNDVDIIGGGAGLLTLVQEPVIFDQYGIYQDGALVVPVQDNMGISVGHGWEQLKGPLLATHTNKNVLHSIDYKDAFDVYKNIIEENSEFRFDDNNFFDIAKQFPIGMITNNNEIIVRDPITVANNSLVLVGEMDQNSPIAILKGEPSKLINAAGKTSFEASKIVEIKKYAFVVDCISRILYLEDKFTQEISAIKEHTKDKQLFGILTLGEIANTNKSYIEFYNKTCVIGVS